MTQRSYWTAVWCGFLVLTILLIADLPRLKRGALLFKADGPQS